MDLADANYTNNHIDAILKIEMILIKQHNSQQVAHLYEHLFCVAIDNLFFDAKLFPSLDYRVYAATLSGGVISIEVVTYTKEAEKIVDDVVKLKINLEDRAINVALLQILAEKEQKLTISGTDVTSLDPIRKELQRVDEKPWQYIDDIDLIDSRKAKMIIGSLYVAQEPEDFPAHKLRVTIALDRQFADSHDELLPLFWQLASLISESIMADLYTTMGFYSKAIGHQPKGRAAKHTHLSHVAHNFPLDLSSVLARAKNVLYDLYDMSAYERLAVEFRRMSHTDQKQALPDHHSLFEHTGIVIGSKGWRRIATYENCIDILSHMKVTVSADRRRASLDVVSTLDTE